MTPALPVLTLQPRTDADDLTRLETILIAMRQGNPIDPLTVDEIDACIAEFNSSENMLSAAKAVHEVHKQALIAVVKELGSVPAHAEQSKRLLGRRNVATVTTATTTSVNEAAVDDLKDYLFDEGHGGTFQLMFSTEIKHKLIDGARNVLAAITLPRRTHEKVLSLFGRCFDIKTKAPSVSVDVIVPEKPARKPRASKAVA